jgi:hypothetical protein
VWWDRCSNVLHVPCSPTFECSPQTIKEQAEQASKKTSRSNTQDRTQDTRHAGTMTTPKSTPATASLGPTMVPTMSLLTSLAAKGPTKATSLDGMFKTPVKDKQANKKQKTGTTIYYAHHSMLFCSHPHCITVQVRARVSDSGSVSPLRWPTVVSPLHWPNPPKWLTPAHRPPAHRPPAHRPVGHARL